MLCWGHQCIALKHYNYHEWTDLFINGWLQSQRQPNQEIKQNSGSHLQTSPWTVLGDDADVGRVDAGSDEPRQVVELNVAHLKITTNTSVSAELSLPLPPLSHTELNGEEGPDDTLRR